ncbi:MAG: CPBP family intramembrane metalloprotease, partial [Anaerolineales bacterium]|nr:CPBP family intramembrane metalloprotease [Anaerolineales bacterium]
MASQTGTYAIQTLDREAAAPAAASLPQYRLGQILAIWAAAALPMGLLGWWVAPALGRGAAQPGLVRLAVLTAGLAWQFVLVVYLLYRETGRLSWSDFRQRLWLGGPRSPQTGEVRGRLWWWLIPVVGLTAAYQMLAVGRVEALWVGLFPFVAEPEGWSLSGAFASPEFRAGLVGNWGLLALYVVNAVLNTVLGEELLFRGVLLPRMAGVFGRLDWAANGLLFGLYHLHQPWGMLSSALDGLFLYALPSRRFRSAWFGVIAHSGQSVLFTVL